MATACILLPSFWSGNEPARKIWEESGLPVHFLDDLNLNDNPDPVVNSSFKLGTVAQNAIGLSALAAVYFHQLRTGVKQTVSIDPRHAILEFKSESYYLLDGAKPPGKLFDELAGLYRTNDSLVAIHTNFPQTKSHKQGILDLLQCEPLRDSVQEVLLKWNSQDFEDEAARRKMCVTKSRTFQEWDGHPHAVALRSIPPVQLIKVADAPKRESCGPWTYPLSGIRVLDLMRVLAGPVAGRTLAAHGADVLLLTSPQLPDLPFLYRDTSRGKRTTQLNLHDEPDRIRLLGLAEETDVFLQAYRPGGLQAKGLGVQDLIKARPGLVYASLTAYGWEGPWKDRRGFDSLVQNGTGFGFTEAQAYQAFKDETKDDLTPKPLPCQAIDHAAGYLLAFGISAALCKTITEGGSWKVRVSLAGVAQWIRSFGQLDPKIAFRPDLALPTGALPWPEELVRYSTKIRQVCPDDYSEDTTQDSDAHSPCRMTAIGHAAKLSITPVREGEAPLRLDAHQARWLDRQK
ncbi:hypothetical protein ACEPAH_8885 [Sanghuangporus vaninii]